MYSIFTIHTTEWTYFWVRVTSIRSFRSRALKLTSRAGYPVFLSARFMFRRLWTVYDCVALSYPRQNHLLWCMHCFSSKASLRVAVVSVQVIFVIFYICLVFIKTVNVHFRFLAVRQIKLAIPSAFERTLIYRIVSYQCTFRWSCSLFSDC